MNPRQWSLAKQRSLKVENGDPKVPKQAKAKREVARLLNCNFSSDIKWCIHISKSLFLYFNYLVSVTAGGPVSPEGICSQVLRSTSVDA